MKQQNVQSIRYGIAFVSFFQQSVDQYLTSRPLNWTDVIQSSRYYHSEKNGKAKEPNWCLCFQYPNYKIKNVNAKNVPEQVPVQQQPEPRPSTSRGSVKKRRYRPGSKALKEIRRYQKGNTNQA